VQVTHFIDYMIMMPLGEQLMRAFQITTGQFAALVAAYAWAASLTGLAGGFVLDRFDRKRALLVLYAGFGLSPSPAVSRPTTTRCSSRAARRRLRRALSSMVNAMVATSCRRRAAAAP